jgi:hypothetical protein
MTEGGHQEHGDLPLSIEKAPPCWVPPVPQLHLMQNKVNKHLSDKMSIQPLPPEVVAQIKSSTTIISLNGVVCELLKNSLDASSKKAEITVDYCRGSCVVEDDGMGILPSEFGEEGGLGKLYRKRSSRGIGTYSDS